MRWMTALIATGSLWSGAHAWHDEGHYYATLAAVESLPPEVPEFFRLGATTAAHVSIDPDVAKNRGTPQLRQTEQPEHYLDLELLKGRSLPGSREDFHQLCTKLGIKPKEVGLLPYAIIEWAQRLTLAFAEHRRSPENPHVQIKCLVYAGLLAHYTTDLSMPLHTTVHWNGRTDTDHSNIHARVDALPTKLPYERIFGKPMPKIPAHTDIFAYVVQQLQHSNELVDRVYELEPRLPEPTDLELIDDEVIKFTINRTRAAAQITATILHSTWKNSATIKLPWWLDRTPLDAQFDPTQIPPQPTPQ